MGSRCRVLRVLAPALAATWALAPLATAFHASAHAHRYCAAHRAFEEGQSPVVALARWSEPSQTSVHGATGATENIQHVKCPVPPPSAREMMAVAERPSPVARLSEPTLATEWRSDHPPIQPLALAPKSSPPAARVVVEA